MNMTRRKDKELTAKFVETVREAGRYADGNGLYLVVDAKGNNKSWQLFFRFGGKRREMGLGSYPEISLAQARADGGVARTLVAQGIDPIEHREQKRNQRWLADKKNLTFKAVAENFINTKTSGPRPHWCKERAHHQRTILNNKLKSLHNLPINSAEAADTLTLKLHELLMAPVTNFMRKDRGIGPRWHIAPKAAEAMKHLAYNIGERAHALKVLPISVANPAGPPLDALLTERQPKGGHWQAIPYNLAPSLFTTLLEFSQPAHPYFSLTEAKRAVGKTMGTIKQAIRDEILPATRAEPSLPAHVAAKLIPYEWRILPADLYQLWPPVIDAIPGVKPVIFDLIMFCVLIGPRPREARELKWERYYEPQGLLVVPWQETKEGEHFEGDMVIPLSEPANAIIQKMKEMQRRYRMQTEYVFANWPSRFNTNAIIGQPPSNVTALENLRKGLKFALPPEHIKATMHGFRTNIRSWGEDQRLPDGRRRFDEKDLERALGHAAGFGKTKVARDYSRQSSDIIPLIPIYDGWAKYVTSGGEPHEVIYDTPFRRNVTGD
jgi:integrase